MYPLDSIPSLQFQAWRSKSDIIFPCDTFDSYLDSDSLSPIALFLLLESKFAKALFENIDAGMRRAKRALDKGGRDEEDSSNHHLGTNQQDSDHESSQKLGNGDDLNREEALLLERLASDQVPDEWDALWDKGNAGADSISVYLEEINKRLFNSKYTHTYICIYSQSCDSSKI